MSQFQIEPDDAHELMLAVLNLLATVPRSRYRNFRRDLAAGRPLGTTTVWAQRLMELLNKVNEWSWDGEGIGDRVIREQEEKRKGGQ